MCVITTATTTAATTATATTTTTTTSHRSDRPSNARSDRPGRSLLEVFHTLGPKHSRAAATGNDSTLRSSTAHLPT